jgi:hypothetical protein
MIRRVTANVKRFRKSSHSGGDNGSQCVEVARTNAAAALRDSKNPAGGELGGEVGMLAHLVTAIRAGRLG